MDEIEENRAVEAIQTLILVVYIVVPFALYTNIINSLKVDFTNNFLFYKSFLSLVIFFIVSLILVQIEKLLIPILLYNPNQNFYKNSIFKDIKNSIKLSILFIFLITILIPVATTDVKNIYFPLSSVLLGIGYSVVVYFVLSAPLKLMQEKIIIETEFYDINNITLYN